MFDKPYYTYIEVCTLAYQNKYEINIMPENNLIEVYDGKILLGKFFEIGCCLFTFIK